MAAYRTHVETVDCAMRWGLRISANVGAATPDATANQSTVRAVLYAIFHYCLFTHLWYSMGIIH